MEVKEFYLKGYGEEEIRCLQWVQPKASETKAIIQIAHGMAEHINRYDDFARFMVQQGYGVFGNDHRGHGKTLKKTDVYGHLSDKKGWRCTVMDLNFLREEIDKQHPHKPVLLLGHSMGSFLALDYAQEFGDLIQGLMLSGTGGKLGLEGNLGLFLARIEKLLRGKKKKSPLLNRLMFGNFNKKFDSEKTPFDWLSANEGEVRDYLEDPLCGNIMTTGFYVDLLEGIQKVHQRGNMEKIPKDLPVFLFSGARDPVGKEGKGVREIKKRFEDHGSKDVSMKLYPEGRHEMLHENNKEEVYYDVLQWTERIVAQEKVKRDPKLNS